jgi:hypothetical protein
LPRIDTSKPAALKSREDSRSLAWRIVRVKSGLGWDDAGACGPAAAAVVSGRPRATAVSVVVTAPRRRTRKDMALRLWS